MKLDEIIALPISEIAATPAHLYLWCPNAMLPEGLAVMRAWGFAYKSNIVWHKVRKDGGSDGRGVGFYFRNVTELVLFGVRGELTHPCSGASTGEFACDPQARAFAQARRTVRHYRIVQRRAVFGVVRARYT